MALTSGQSAGPPSIAPKKTANPKPVAAKRQAVKSRVDYVIQLFQNGMSEELMIKGLKGENKPTTLSPAEMAKLQTAGVPESVIEVLMDPSATPRIAAATPVSLPTRVDKTNSPAIESAPHAEVAPDTRGGWRRVSANNVNDTVVSRPASVPKGKKQRVIVDDFDYSAVATAVQQIFLTNQNIGRGIRAMLVKRVAEDGKLVVVERAKIDKLQAEQERNVSNRSQQGSGARIGRISGADALLAGDIVVFGRDDRQMRTTGGGKVGEVIGRVAGMFKEEKAVVAINYRLLDAETSEVIATGEARGESVRKSKGVGGLIAALGSTAGVEVDMTSSGFAETIIGEATMDCINKLTAILSHQADKIHQRVREVEAQVAHVNGSLLTISAGSGDGVNPGEIFEIHQVLDEVKDPTTKEVLDRATWKVGEMTIDTVRDRVSEGVYSGSRGVKVGFIARKKI